jgi:hypothetical protein
MEDRGFTMEVKYKEYGMGDVGWKVQTEKRWMMEDVRYKRKDIG